MRLIALRRKNISSIVLRKWPGLELAARAVGAALVRGLPQDAAVYGFMESAFGRSGPDALAEILGKGDTSDALILRSLLLTPGSKMLAALEPALEAARCTPAEAKVLADHLAAACRTTWAVLPIVPPSASATSGGSGSHRLLLPLEPDDVRAFVRGLRPERTPPAEITTLLDARFSREEAVSLKVLLRHCRLEWTPSRLAFLVTLLGRMPDICPSSPRRDPSLPDDSPLVANSAACSPDAGLPVASVGASLHDDGSSLSRQSGSTGNLSLLEWAVRFLDDAGPLVLPRPTLTRRYRELTVQLARAQQFDQNLAASSYEIMMAQGMRGPHLHAGSLQEELAFLDQTCRAVLGMPAAFLDAPLEAHMGTYDDAEALMAALTGLDAPDPDRRETLKVGEVGEWGEKK